jgi:uncharacterized damage-inducible protein DinB
VVAIHAYILPTNFFHGGRQMSVFTNPASSSKEQAQAYTSAILELLGERAPLDVLTTTEAALRQRVEGVARDRLRKPEMPGKWSVAQVLQHLADSDLVWAWRVRLVLSQDRPTLTGYDQDAWAERLRYQDADPAHALEEFSAVRSANLRLLARVSADDYKRVGVHVERGDESVEHMMRLYAGHDLLHLNQIDRILRTV